MLQGGNEQLASQKYLRKDYVWYKFSVDIVLDIHCTVSCPTRFCWNDSQQSEKQIRAELTQCWNMLIIANQADKCWWWCFELTFVLWLIWWRRQGCSSSSSLCCAAEFHSVSGSNWHEPMSQICLCKTFTPVYRGYEWLLFKWVIFLAYSLMLVVEYPAELLDNGIWFGVWAGQWAARGSRLRSLYYGFRLAAPVRTESLLLLWWRSRSPYWKSHCPALWLFADTVSQRHDENNFLYDSRIPTHETEQSKIRFL